MPITFPIANGDVAQITFRQEYQGSTLLNVFHYEAVQFPVGSPIIDGRPEMIALLDTLSTGASSLGQRIRDVQVDSITWNPTQGQIVYPTRRPYVRNALSAVGALDLEGMPSNVDAVITKRGSIAGRGRAGSVHIGAIPRTGVEEAKLAAALVTDLNAIVTPMLATVAMLAANWSWVPIIGVPYPGPTDVNILGNGIVQDTVRVVRRRTFRVGI